MSAPSASSPSSPLRGKFARLIAALLLLAATWHALTPGWSPVEPAHGSAFNAATAELQAVAPAAFAAPARISTIDGLRVDWPDGFGLIRASNTTPVLVLRFEGHTPEALHRIEAEMLALLERVKPGAQVGSATH